MKPRSMRALGGGSTLNGCLGKRRTHADSGQLVDTPNLPDRPMGIRKRPCARIAQAGAEPWQEHPIAAAAATSMSTCDMDACGAAANVTEVRYPASGAWVLAGASQGPGGEKALSHRTFL